MSKLIIADLFSGVGGLSQGFISQGFEVEFAIEYDKDIALSYQKNHPSTKMYSQDISTIDFEELKKNHSKIDVVVGGPPCQGFSIFGNRRFINTKGFKPKSDKRNNLVLKFWRYVELIKPTWVIMENVAGFPSTILASTEGRKVTVLFKS